MITQSNEEYKKSFRCLEHIIKDRPKVDKLTSETNIVNNVVQIYNRIPGEPENKFSIGSAQRLTSDGWLLTAYHNIERVIDKWKVLSDELDSGKVTFNTWINDVKQNYNIVDQDNNVYPIDPTSLSYNPELDLALVKAYTKFTPYAYDINVAEEAGQDGDFIKIAGFRDRRLYMQFGRIIESYRDCNVSNFEDEKVNNYNTFLTDAYCTKGFSGGTVLGMEGEFLGVNLYSSWLEDDDVKEIGYCGAARIEGIRNLIKGSVKGALGNSND